MTSELLINRIVKRIVELFNQDIITKEVFKILNLNIEKDFKNLYGDYDSYNLTWFLFDLMDILDKFTKLKCLDTDIKNYCRLYTERFNYKPSVLTDYSKVNNFDFQNSDENNNLLFNVESLNEDSFESFNDLVYTHSPDEIYEYQLIKIIVELDKLLTGID